MRATIYFAVAMLGLFALIALLLLFNLILWGGITVYEHQKESTPLNYEAGFRGQGAALTQALGGDLNLDGVIDERDMAIVRANFTEKGGKP